MTVEQLIAKLQKCDPTLEVLYSGDDGVYCHDYHIDYVYEDERQYGWLLKPLPPKQKVVVLSD